jgi:hypothetical protein
MPAIMVDNTPASFRFKDGNPLSDGMASFAASIANAGPAAAQVRRQREQDSVAAAFQQAQGARADRALDLQSLWHQQANDMNLAKSGVYAGEDPTMLDLARKVSMAGAQKAQGDQQQLDLQGQLTRAQIANLQADNARASLGQFGSGLNEAVKRGIDVLKLGGGGDGSRDGYSPITPNDYSGRVFAFDRKTGQVREVTPKVPTAPVGGQMPTGATPQAAGAPTPAAAAPAMRSDSAPRLDEWKAVLAQPGSPQFTASLNKLRAWEKGIDPDTNQPFPQGPQWAVQIRALLEQMAAEYDQQQGVSGAD